MNTKSIKLGIFGDLNVGKTSLLTQLTQRYFEDVDTEDPYFIDTYSKTIELTSGGHYNVEIYDTVDVEDFFHDDINLDLIKESDGILFAFDISSTTSFESLTSNYYRVKRILAQQSKDIPLILVGLKCDLEYERQVSSHQALAFVKEADLNGYFECSSKSGYNVEHLFTSMVEEIENSNEHLSQGDNAYRKKSIISLHSSVASNPNQHSGSSKIHPMTSINTEQNNIVVEESEEGGDRNETSRSRSATATAPKRGTSERTKELSGSKQSEGCCVIV